MGAWITRGKTGGFVVGWYEAGRRRQRTLRQRAAAVSFRAQVDLGQAGGGRIAWPAFVARYLSHLALRSRPATLRNARRALEALQLTWLHQATSSRLALHFDNRRGRGGRRLAASTLNTERRVVRAALAAAVRWELLAKLPAIPCERLRRRLPRVLTDQEVRGLAEAAAAAGWLWRSLVPFLLCTGWRVSQALAISWPQVDLAAGQIAVPATIAKGGRPALLPISPALRPHLLRIRAACGLVFPWPASRSTFYRHWCRLAAAAGLPAVRPHDLRRTFATRNAELLPLPVVQELLQHSSPAITGRYLNAAPAAVAAGGELYQWDV